MAHWSQGSAERRALYLCSLPQAVETGKLRELGKAAVIDAEMEMLIQDSEIFIAPPHNPASSLRSSKRGQLLKR